MIRVRHLTENDMEKVFKIKLSCWTEALARKAENTLAMEKQLIFWANWMHTAQEHQDVRLLLGAFEAEQLLGVAFASFADMKLSE
jgi:uncharacterized protein (DUF1800 family)